jgi:hypothetical protein
VAIATVATWGWSAALAAMTALLAPVTIFAAAAAAVFLGSALTVVGGAVVGAAAAAQGLFGLLAGMPTLAPGINVVGGVLSEWGTILMEVARVARTDLPAAWDILQAGAALAVQQVRALFPPLWKFIQDGFKAAWDFVAAVFNAKFDLIAIKARNIIYGVGGAVIAAAELAEQTAIQNATATAAAALAGAAETFNSSVATALNSEAVEAARRALRTSEIMAIFAEEEGGVPAPPPAINQWAEGFNSVAEAAHHAKHAISEFKGVAAGSAADASILSNYLDMLKDAPTHRPVPAVSARPRAGGAPPPEPGRPQQVAMLEGGGGAAGAGQGLGDVVAVLRQIYVQLRDNPTVQVEDANIATV